MTLAPVHRTNLWYARYHFAELDPRVRPGERRFRVLLGSGVGSYRGGRPRGGGGGVDILRRTGGVQSALVVPVFFDFSEYAQVRRVVLQGGRCSLDCHVHCLGGGLQWPLSNVRFTVHINSGACVLQLLRVCTGEEGCPTRGKVLSGGTDREHALPCVPLPSLLLILILIPMPLWLLLALLMLMALCLLVLIRLFISCWCSWVTGRTMGRTCR